MVLSAHCTGSSLQDHGTANALWDAPWDSLWWYNICLLCDQTHPKPAPQMALCFCVYVYNLLFTPSLLLLLLVHIIQSDGFHSDNAICIYRIFLVFSTSPLPSITFSSLIVPLLLSCYAFFKDSNWEKIYVSNYIHFPEDDMISYS
jgi:hypothetical protein